MSCSSLIKGSGLAILESYFNKAKLKKQDFEGISLEAFMAIDKKLLGTFLKDNGFPKAYTADRVREEVRNGKLKPSCYFASTNFRRVSNAGCRNRLYFKLNFEFTIEKGRGYVPAWMV